MAISQCPGRALLGVLLLAAALMACPRTAAAQSVNVTYGGADYEISQVSGTTTTIFTLNTTFWWPTAATAREACTMVNATMGLTGGLGPYFVYSVSPSLDFYAYTYNTFGQLCGNFSGTSTDEVFFAQSTDLTASSPSPSASPEASPSASPEDSPSASPEDSPSASPEASPSASPVPLDCSLAVFSPAVLSSRVTGAICAASKAVRRGKESKLVTNVTLSLLDAAINITDIVTNKLTAGWQCKCRPTGRDNCTCLPNAVLLGGGNFLVMPQWRRSTRPGSIVDTTLQVSFTATTVDGGTCSGTAVICSAWGVRPNTPPPVCTPFNSTGVTRPALTCI